MLICYVSISFADNACNITCDDPFSKDEWTLGGLVDTSHLCTQVNNNTIMIKEFSKSPISGDGQLWPSQIKKLMKTLFNKNKFESEWLPGFGEYYDDRPYEYTYVGRGTKCQVGIQINLVQQFIAIYRTEL